MKVMLDVGHGGTDAGATGNGLLEKDLNLYTARRTRELLLRNARSAGLELEVELTRYTDATLSRSQRLGIIADFNPHVCISIHHNSAASPAARGSEIYHSANDHRDDALAELLVSSLAATGMPSRGAKTRTLQSGTDYYYIIREIRNKDTVALLYEGAFVSSPQDAAMLKSGWMDLAAEAISDAVLSYLASRYWPGQSRTVDGPRLLIEGHELPLRIVDGRSYAPVRQLLETLGYKVFWDGETETVTARK